MSKTKDRLKRGYLPTDLHEPELPENVQEKMGNVWTMRSTKQMLALRIFGGTDIEEFVRVSVADLPDSLQSEGQRVADEGNGLWVRIRPA
jgi:hypothetical protein